MQYSASTRILSALLMLAVASVGVVPAFGKTKAKRKAATSTSAKKKTTSKKASTSTARSKRTRKASYTKGTRHSSRRARKVYSPWDTPTFADSTYGDAVDGEDLTVRRAAVEALGAYNGTVVVVDPQSGRILSLVNQKVALKSGFQPCSTIKLVAALAGLSEGIVDRNTMLRLYGRTRMNLTEALAHSNNQYFANLGTKLGFERVTYYAKLFGLGEPAGLDIPGESPGVLPSSPPQNGGVGMMTSFGEGIEWTPLQLASLLSAIANGGTLYYLQYPHGQQEIASFVPRVKRHLDIQHWIPEIRPGMMAAVEYGTARRAAYDPDEPIMGKTGTCTSVRTHMGWFGSFNNIGDRKLVVVVMLTGGRGVSGPVAAGIAGKVYKGLSEKQFFAGSAPFTPAALVSTQSCCAN